MEKYLKKYIILAYLIGFFFLFFISVKFWFFQSDILIGHNWDFTFPEDNIFSDRIANLSNLTFTDFLGSRTLILSHLIQNNLYSFLSSFFSVSIVNKIIILFTFLIAYLSMYILLYFFSKNKTSNAIVALLYSFSPYIFSVMIGGSWYAWLAYAFAPMFYYGFIKFISNGSFRCLLIILISSMFLIGFLQFFVIVNSLLIFHLLVLTLNKEINVKTIIKRYIFLTLSLIGVNLFWLIPFIVDFTTFNKTILSNPEITWGFHQVYNNTQSIENIFTLTGFLDRNFYLNSLTQNGKFVFYFSIIALWLIILFSILKKKKLLLYFMLFFLLITLLVKGGNEPFSQLTMFIYENVIFMKMFRSPQNIFFIIAFLFPILLILSIGQTKFYKMLLPLFVFGSLIGWYKGDLGHFALRDNNRGHVDFYYLDPEIKKIYQNNENRALVHNELFIPLAVSVDYKDTDWQYKAQGGIPSYMYLKNISNMQNYNNNDFILSLMNKIDYQQIAMNSIRYISFRSDILHHFESVPNIYYKQVKKTLDEKLQTIYKGERHSTYLVSDKNYFPMFYICNNYVIADVFNKTLFDSLSIEESMCVISKKDNNIDLLNNIKVTDIRNHTKVEYRKISPTKYRVRINNLNPNDKFILRFSKKYDSNWKIYSQYFYQEKNNYQLYDKELNSYDEITSDEYKKLINLGVLHQKDIEKEFISKDFKGTIQNDNLSVEYEAASYREFKVNNNHLTLLGKPFNFTSWIIDVKKYLQTSKSKAITLNKNGTYTLDMLVEYKLESAATIGRILSLLSIFIIICCYFLFKRKQKSF